MGSFFYVNRTFLRLRGGRLLANEKTKRPIIHIPRSSFEKVGEILALIGIFASFITLFFYWSALPQTIPIHFNIFGKPTLWGEKTVLIRLCLILYFLTLFLTVIVSFPHKLNYPFSITEINARNQYKLLRTFLIFLKLELIYPFLYIQVKITLIALKLSEDLGSVVLSISLFLFIVTTIIYFYKAYQGRNS